MRQIDNINTIEYLRSILKELAGYSIDVSEYQKELDNLILDYENSKKQDLESIENDKVNLSIVSDLELNLHIKLDSLTVKLSKYITFLELIHVTNSWNLEEDIDDVFYSLNGHKIDQLIDKFYQIDKQKNIISRYYDLVLMKIIKDYETDNYEYLEKYNHLKKYVYLCDSIRRYVKDSNRNIEGDVSNYQLESIMDKLCDKKSDDKKEEVQEVRQELVVKDDNRSRKLDVFYKVQNFIYTIYLCAPQFAWLGSTDRVAILERVGIEKLKEKDFRDCDLSDLDLSDVDFNGVYIYNTNLENTGAVIDPQKILFRTMKSSKLAGCYVINNFWQYFARDVSNLDGAILVDKGYKKKVPSEIDLHSSWFDWLGISDREEIFSRVGLERLLCKDFSDCDLRGLNLSGVNFARVSLSHANLTNTGAIIDFFELRGCEGAILEGCYVLGSDCIDKYMYRRYRKELEGVIFVNNFDEIDNKNKIRKRLGIKNWK